MDGTQACPEKQAFAFACLLSVHKLCRMASSGRPLHDGRGKRAVGKAMGTDWHGGQQRQQHERKGRGLTCAIHEQLMDDQVLYRAWIGANHGHCAAAHTCIYICLHRSCTQCGARQSLATAITCPPPPHTHTSRQAGLQVSATIMIDAHGPVHTCMQQRMQPGHFCAYASSSCDHVVDQMLIESRGQLGAH